MSLVKEKAGAITFGLVGFLFLVELVSGILQGFYVPLIPDLVDHLGIKDADFNWFEAAQLLLSAIVVPILAKCGDMFGHKRILLIATVLTAGSTWALAFTNSFTTFLIAWALQGFYVVWLPLEVALIFDRGRVTGRGASQTRRAAGYLVVALEAGAIIGALGAGRIFKALGGDVQTTLMVPAVAVTLVFFAILFGVPESKPLPGRSLDLWGFVLLTIGLLFITSGLTFLRINGPSAWWCYLLMVVGVLIFIPWSRYELKQKDPAIDLRVLKQPNMWPVQLTAGLVGISLLGAQAPLATFAGTDPINGYGLGMAADEISYIIGAYLVSMIVAPCCSRGCRNGSVLASPSSSPPSSWRRAICCSSSTTPRSLASSSTWPLQESAPVRWWEPCRLPPRLPPRAGRPASRPHSPTPPRRSVDPSPRRRSRSCSPPERPARSRRPHRACSATSRCSRSVASARSWRRCCSSSCRSSPSPTWRRH